MPAPNNVYSKLGVVYKLLHSHSLFNSCKLIGLCVLSPNLPYTKRYGLFKSGSSSTISTLRLRGLRKAFSQTSLALKVLSLLEKSLYDRFSASQKAAFVLNRCFILVSTICELGNFVVFIIAFFRV